MRAARIRRTVTALAWAIGIAVFAAGAAHPVVSANDLSGGPLWWLPENDSNWSRFHDVWHESPVENAAWGTGQRQVSLGTGSLDVTTGAGTSFPEGTWVTTRLNGYSTDFMPNSACDVLNGVVQYNVGPPLTEDEYPSAARRSRTPDNNSGGLGGLQMSVHLGEWWQGLLFDNVAPSAYRWPDGWNAADYGYFRVRTTNNAGQAIWAFGPNGPWDRMVARPGMFLEGGGSGTHACIGQALVMMHGAGDGMGRGVYPDRPVDASGEPCYAQARLFVLRGNTEARCEPDLSEEYELTRDFWVIFNDPSSAVTLPGPLQPYYGTTAEPLFPFDDYEPGLPIFRRGEFGIFTAGEFAEVDASIQPVPWNTGIYSSDRGDVRRESLVPLLADDRRPQPFGGGTVTLRHNTGTEMGVVECLEMGAAGWDAATGTFDPQCPDPWTSENRFTGVVNHENDGLGQTVRPQEGGRRDNREAVGVATIRRATPGWDQPGYQWFEHKSGPIGCLMLRWVGDWDLPLEAQDTALALQVTAGELAALQSAPCPPGLTPAQCAAFRAVARAEEYEARRLAAGWMVIYRWRVQVLYSVWSALGAYRELWEGSGRTLIARGRGAGRARDGRCYTGPVGQLDSYNERLAPSASDQVPATEWLNPAWSGQTYWGSDMQEQAWWGSAGADHDYHYFAEVRGTVTKRVEDDVRQRTGLDTPFPLDLGHDYLRDRVRSGEYTFREFACPTADHAGYYGAGVTHLGPQTLNHRDAPVGQAWQAPDPLIDPEQEARRYSSGTPCIDEAESPVSALTGDPLSQYYNAHGSDPDSLETGSERCYPTRRPTAGEIEEGVDPDAWLPVDGTPGQWSNPGRGGLASRYYLEYSGDLEAGPQPAGDPKMRPTAYVFQDNFGSVRLEVREDPMDLWFGMQSYDIERRDMAQIWSLAFGEPDMRVRSAESYAGVAPGFCPAGGCGEPPIDWGQIQYDGPIRFFGAGGIGGTGGCVLQFDGTPFDIPAVNDGRATDVMAPGQSLVCLLPVSVADRSPTGTCPRPGVGR